MARTERTQVSIPEEAQQPVVDAAKEVGHGGRPGSANDSGWCRRPALDGRWTDAAAEAANLDP
jgi:hypothetical protein